MGNVDPRKIGTTHPILAEARMDHDPFDEFAWCQEWRFALADYLVWDLGEYVYGYRSNGPNVDSYAYSALVVENYSAEQAEYALKILDRYREWLRIAGRDY